MSILSKVYEFQPLEESDTIERVIEVGEIEYDSYDIDLDRFDPDSFSIGVDL